MQTPGLITPMMVDPVAQVSTAVFVSHLIEWLKTQKWFPIASIGAPWMNRISSLIAALVTTGAIHYTLNATGDFVFTGNLYTALSVLKVAAEQYALQHLIYKTAIKK